MPQSLRCSCSLLLEHKLRYINRYEWHKCCMKFIDVLSQLCSLFWQGFANFLNFLLSPLVRDCLSSAIHQVGVLYRRATVVWFTFKYFPFSPLFQLCGHQRAGSSLVVTEQSNIGTKCNSGDQWVDCDEEEIHDSTTYSLLSDDFPTINWRLDNAMMSPLYRKISPSFT